MHVGVGDGVPVDVNEVLGVKTSTDGIDGTITAPRHSLKAPREGQFVMELLAAIPKPENAQPVPHLPGSVVPCCQNLAKT